MSSEYLVAWASVVSVVLALLSTAAAWSAARAASDSARTARKKFRADGQSFPYIKWDDARLIVTLDGPDEPRQAGLIISGRVHEASNVPTTLHRVRMRLRVGLREVGYVEGPGPFQDARIEREELLFGKHVYYPLYEVRPNLTINRAEYKDSARRGVPIVVVETELVVSGPEQHPETWHITAWLIHSRSEDNGFILSVRAFPPRHDHESDRLDDTEREPLRPHFWSTC
jgi:hypothetical protein